MMNNIFCHQSDFEDHDSQNCQRCSDKNKYILTLIEVPELDDHIHLFRMFKEIFNCTYFDARNMTLNLPYKFAIDLPKHIAFKIKWYLESLPGVVILLGIDNSG